MDDAGQTLVDYAIFDALRAGFGRVVVVVNPAADNGFLEHLRAGAGRYVDVVAVPQRLDALPDGFAVPAGRVKPWGTAHAVWCAAGSINGPFATVNADDFYGRTAFAKLADFLRRTSDGHHALVAYELQNTLSSSGCVARGVCHTNADGFLGTITEHTRIEPATDGRIVSQTPAGVVDLPPSTPVSLNLWGFHPGFLDELTARFHTFLSQPTDPLTSEFFLPAVVDALIRDGEADVRVLPTAERWHGVTYAADLPAVRNALRALREAGCYPERLWE